MQEIILEITISIIFILILFLIFALIDYDKKYQELRAKSAKEYFEKMKIIHRLQEELEQLRQEKWVNV